MIPGAPSTDAPVSTKDGRRWLIECLGGVFLGLYFALDMQELESGVVDRMAALMRDQIPVFTQIVVNKGSPLALPEGILSVEDSEGLAAQRFDATAGTFYLVRPDQHICGRWRRFDPQKVRLAVAKATCNERTVQPARGV
jgi:3-(3-hydroxy-phenyl)propionate hydroxylase